MAYPVYLYYKDKTNPIRVDTKAKEVEMTNLGWTVRYQHKEYPKWIDGKIVKTEAEEKRLSELNPTKKPAFKIVDNEDVKVVKETRLDNVDTTVVEKPRGPGRPKR